MSTKIERLTNEVQKELKFYTNTFSIKVNVGDSTNNNRVPSVRQVIRFLNTSLFGASLGADLEATYTTLQKKKLFKKLRRTNSRTDAVDINEFLTVVNKYVVKNPSLKATLGRNILSV